MAVLSGPTQLVVNQTGAFSAAGSAAKGASAIAYKLYFGGLATIEPRSGIVAFAAVVVLTMLATDAFDPHWLWRGAGAAPTRCE